MPQPDQSPAARLLIIEDDPSLGAMLVENLTAAGYATVLLRDGEAGLMAALQADYDLLLLDIMLPSLDGLQLLSRLRHHKKTPVLLLTARGAEEDRLSGFRNGADDYLTKPFSTPELLLRIEAILRRTRQEQQQSPRQLSYQGLLLDLDSQRASWTDQDIALTTTEFEILAALLLEPGEVLSKPYLYQVALKKDYSRYDRTLDMHISHIRRKLDDSGLGKNAIKTVFGKGYCVQ